MYKSNNQSFIEPKEDLRYLKYIELVEEVIKNRNIIVFDDGKKR